MAQTASICPPQTDSLHISRSPTFSLQTASTATLSGSNNREMSTIPPVSGFPSLRVSVVDIIRLKQKADRIKFQFDTPFDPYFDPDGQSRGISESMYDDLLVLSRHDHIEDDTKKLVWDVILGEICAARYQALARALTRQPVEEVHVFFARLQRRQHALATFEPRNVKASWSEINHRSSERLHIQLLVAFICHSSSDVLSYADISALLVSYPTLQPFLTLVQKTQTEAFSSTSFLDYARRDYTRLSVDAYEPHDHPPDLILDSAATYLSDPQRAPQLRIIVRDLLACIRADIPGLVAPRACREMFAMLRAAVYLVRGSAEVSSSLLQADIVGLVEELYYRYPQYGPDSGLALNLRQALGQQQCVLTQLCYALLRAVALHCRDDLRECSVKGEMRDEIVAVSRRVSLSLIEESETSLGLSWPQLAAHAVSAVH